MNTCVHAHAHTHKPGVGWAVLVKAETLVAKVVGDRNMNVAKKLVSVFIFCSLK